MPPFDRVPGFRVREFDGLGRQRELDNGLPIDTSGSSPFADGAQPFADGNELLQILAGSAQVHTCYSEQLTGYALGRDVVESDRPLLEALAEVSQSHAGDTTNSPLLNALISAAIQDTGETIENFWAGPAGQLPVVLA